MKKLFLEEIMDKILETNFRFHVKQRSTGKVHLLFFIRFLLALTTFSLWEEE